MKRLGILVLAALLCFGSAFGCAAKADQTQEEDEVQKNPIATITMADGGVMKLELYPDIAPNTVKNFIALANSGFYDGTVFHRIYAGFMIQGGDPEANGSGGPGYSIKGEFTANGFQNDLSHERGVISMARATKPNSAGSQFFIMHADYTGLDGQYAAFGKLIEGYETLDAIAATPVTYNEWGEKTAPTVDVVMQTVRVETFGVDYGEPEKIINPVATITMADGGVMKLELYPDVAPNTVKNFISLANSGFYDGTVFHRIYAGFMIQGGDPQGNGSGGPGYSIKGEFLANGFQNGLSHVRGVISMARATNPDSAGSQFFIMHANYTGLDGQYAAFGKLIEGYETLDAIAATPVTYNARGEKSVPTVDVVIQSIRVETFGVDYGEPEKISK